MRVCQNPFLVRFAQNHEVLATEREPEGQAQRSKSNKSSQIKHFLINVSST